MHFGQPRSSFRGPRPLWSALLLIGLLGCGDSKPSAPAAEQKDDGKVTIAVIPKGTLHDFWKSVHAGVEKAQAEIGPDKLEIIWKGPVREDDRNQQIDLVQDFINSGVDAIVLAPLDKTALKRPVDRARKKKIPVVIMDSALASDDIDSYVATDNVHGGAIAAEFLAEKLGGKGNVVMLRYQLGSASTEEREQGFTQTMKEKYPNIKILSDELYGGAQRDGNIAKAQDLLTRFPDQIDGWFCPNETVTFGTLKALQAKGKAGKIVVVGFDTGSEIVGGLEAGEITALVVQDPVNIGYLAVKSAYDAQQGKPVEKRIATGENLITQENKGDPKSKTLLNPPQAKE